VRNLAVDPQDIETTDGIRKRGIEALLSVDEQIGSLLDLFVELGIDRDTLVLLTSDNGAAWGEHRYFLQAKHCPYEECMRVPMIVRYPRTIPAKKVIGNVAVLNLDIAPTLAALAGATIPVPIDGVSFHSWIVGEKPSIARTDFLMECWQAPAYFGVRDIAGKTSYAEYRTGEKELYDLAVDPYQLTNVVDDPQYAAVRKRAATRLAELLPPWFTGNQP
jgi:arylsulfatase A-like enzyme